MRKTVLFLLLCVSTLLLAQVTTSPSPIQVSDLSGTVVITFDPNGGNGGMKNATKCYCHTGLITAASTGDGDWKNVIGSWRGATQPQLTKTADGKWQLTINNVYTFYGVPSTTEILKIAFVFHDGPGGSKEGKSADGSDIFVAIAGVDQQTGIWRGFTPAAVVQQARPAGISNGIYYGSDGTSVTLCTYAASKSAPANHVFLIGDMTNWQLNNQYQLKRDGNYFWITLTGLTAGREYRFQYAVERADGKHVQISDLYSEKLLHPDDKYEPKTADPSLMAYPTTAAEGYVSVIQPGKPPYNWQCTNFVRPNKNNLIIYELWTYDFSTRRTYNGVREQLDYIESLGVNAIELMPVCEFDGNLSWGYNPNHYFAPDKAYGPANELKALIDECHRRGIAVILDMVFNHASGNNPMNKLYPYGSDLSSNPWFNTIPPHGDNVLEDWNHDFGPAHEMFIRAMKYWIEEYHVDGYRLDLSHGLCGPSYNAVSNLKDYFNQAIATHTDAAGTPAYLILEHWGSNMGSDRPQLVSAGMQCWTNNCNAYCQTAMGWLKDGDDMNESNKDGYVSYTCSHDEERPFYKALMYGNGDIKTNTQSRNSRIAANVGINVLMNGSHMIWQFEELGYDVNIDYNGRTGSKPHPSTKGYMSDALRMAQKDRLGKICQLRTRILPHVFVGNPTASSLNSGQALRSIQWGDSAFAVANFGIDNQAATLPSGNWYDYLNGATRATSTITLAPGEIRVFTGRPITAPVTPTDIKNDAKTSVPASHKILRHGRICILRANRLYDLDGRLIE